MEKQLVYFNKYGLITGVTSGPDAYIDKLYAHQGVLLSLISNVFVDIYCDFVDKDARIIKNKSVSPVTMIDQTISNIHNPSTVDCGELGSYEVTDGEFIFTIDTPGTYTITIRSVPYFDKVFEVIIP